MDRVSGRGVWVGVDFVEFVELVVEFVIYLP